MPSGAQMTLRALAPAKVNLSLHVLGRRGDGYHELDSLVMFADIGDGLSLDPGNDLWLDVHGPSASRISTASDNLVIKAARALAAHIDGLRLGAFRLDKRLPVAAGLGGGSADAAAALRLLAELNRISPDDPRLLAAAAEVGADVTVCLDAQPALMRGVGHEVTRLPNLPGLDAVLVNPNVALETKSVFAELGLAPGEALPGPRHPEIAEDGEPHQLIAALAQARNDLEGPALRLAPVMGSVIATLRAAGALLTRMSGSGATVVGLMAGPTEAQSVAARLTEVRPDWWVKPARLGGLP